MRAFLVGNNNALLTFFSQSLPATDVLVVADIIPVNQLLIDDKEAIQLLIFDINDPIPDFAGAAAFLKKKFPSVTLWAIFDSPSEALRKELKRIGFEKIIRINFNGNRTIQFTDLLHGAGYHHFIEIQLGDF